MPHSSLKSCCTSLPLSLAYLSQSQALCLALRDGLTQQGQPSTLAAVSLNCPGEVRTVLRLVVSGMTVVGCQGAGQQYVGEVIRHGAASLWGLRSAADGSGIKDGLLTEPKAFTWQFGAGRRGSSVCGN
jgi:hypothetical protein